MDEVGVFRPSFTPVERLGPGEAGYVAASIKTLAEAHVGDTITDARNPAPQPLPGYRKVKSVVFCGFYPVERDDYPQLRDALEKLCLNDSAIVFEPETWGSGSDVVSLGCSTWTWLRSVSVASTMSSSWLRRPTSSMRSSRSPVR